MRIRVSYAELKSGPSYNHRRAEAEVEVEVNPGTSLDAAFDRAWKVVRNEVGKQLVDRSDCEDEPLPF